MTRYLFFAIPALVLVSCTSAFDDSIKQGSFNSCPDYTVETLVNGFFSDPVWESFVSPDDDKYHLNVSGGILYGEEDANALIQFEFLEEDNWQINAFEINNVPQNDFIIEELVVAMCDEMTNS